MKMVEDKTLFTRPLPAESGSPIWARVVSAVAVVGGLVLRWANLGRQSLWFDEGYTAWAVSNPVGEIIRIIRVDTAPPLYYILLRGWTHLFGFSEVALRSMSALMASIGLVVFVGIARRMFKSPLAAALAISLFSFSFMQISYAHEARFYAMMTMMAAIDLYLVLLVCDRSTIPRLIALSIAWAISLWTNNLMAVYLACLGIGWLILPGKRKLAGRISDAAIVCVFAALAFAPWVPTMLAQTRRIREGFWPSTPDAWLLGRTISVMAGVNEKGLPKGDWRGFLAVNIVLGGLAILACISSTGRRRAVAMFSFGIVPILLIFVYSHTGQSIFTERAFLASGVAIPMLAALPIDVARVGRSLSVLCVCGMLGLSWMSLPGHRLGDHAENWRDACAYAQSTQPNRRLVVCVSSDGEPLFRYYACDRKYGPMMDVTAIPRSFFALDPPRTMQRVKSDHDLDALRSQLTSEKYDEVVLIASHTWWGDHTERTLTMLQNGLMQTDSRVFTGVTVFRFKPRIVSRLEFYQPPLPSPRRMSLNSTVRDLSSGMTSIPSGS